MVNVDALFDLTGRTALVTGGSSGLGREMVLAFAQAGADVVIASRKLEACEAVAEEVRATTGRRAEVYSVHMGRWDEIDGLVDFVWEKFGKLDILVNNAGMSPGFDKDKLDELPEKLFDAVVNLNFKGPFRLTALAGARMVRDGVKGSIINISSSGAIHPNPTIIPYVGAKLALTSMTEAFAKAFAPNIRVNVLMPGGFATPAHPEWTDPEVAASAKHTALGRYGQPPEIVGAALFLASDASSYTTGSVLRADGGSA